MRVLGFVAALEKLFAGREAPPCPKCHDDRLVEWDQTLRRFVCDVCSHQWSPARKAASWGL